MLLHEDKTYLFRQMRKHNVASMKEYYSSSRWKLLKSIKSNEKKFCSICKSPKGLQLHHKTYERFGEEDLNDLCWVCYLCHEAIHNISNRYMKPVEQTTQMAKSNWKDNGSRKGFVQKDTIKKQTKNQRMALLRENKNNKIMHMPRIDRSLIKTVPYPKSSY